MNIISILLPPLGTNCYIVPTGGSEAVVIDPASDGEGILSKAEAAGLEIKKILLTHGHFDHTGGALFIKEQTGAPIYIHSADTELLSDADKALSFFCPELPFVPLTADVQLSDGDIVSQGDMQFAVMHTPGHTAGSVCFLCSLEGRDVMFAGDTIFKDSIGRSDTYSGDRRVQSESLDKLSRLEKDYIIYPGHGESTTLFTEKRFNPFLSGIL